MVAPRSASGPPGISDHGGELPLQGGRAVGLAVAGLPLDALRAAAGSRRLAQGAGMGILRTELDIAEAIAARELGDRERAAPALEVLATQPSFPCSYVQGLALLEVVEMRLREGGDAGSDRSSSWRTWSGATSRARRPGVAREGGCPGRPGRREHPRRGAVVAPDRRRVLATDQ